MNILPRSASAFFIGLALLFLVPRLHAGSSTWKANPSSGDWNTAANWTPRTVPNGANDTATFQSSTQTNVSLSANTEVNGIAFPAGASSSSVTTGPLIDLTMSGAGISNASGVTQTLIAATQDNQTGGSVIFRNNATAGDATLVANGQNQNSGSGGRIQFLDSSDGGTAHVLVYGSSFVDLRGTLDISAHNPPGVAIGSIAGTGVVAVGTNNLTVGGDKSLSTTFGGDIHDDFNGAGAGFFTKIGRSTFTLTGVISCYGGTTIKAGTLWLNKPAKQITIQGPVQVERGTLGGTGAIWAYGDVIIGTGSSSGAKLVPAKTARKPGTLQVVNGRLIFNPLSTYQCLLNRDTGTASQVFVAPQDVIINPNVTFVFVDTGTGTVTPGAVFTILGNGGPDPITGTFSNLPDGSTFTSNGTTFKVNYEGGDGNDLTLTVQ